MWNIFYFDLTTFFVQINIVLLYYLENYFILLSFVVKTKILITVFYYTIYFFNFCFVFIFDLIVNENYHITSIIR